MESDLRSFIKNYITQRVVGSDNQTPYRAPLVGFAAADDPLWATLQEVADPTHQLPTDLLPTGRTVVAFFIPFAESVVTANRRQREEVAEEWGVAYRETNALINSLIAGLKEELAQRGIRAAGAPSTHNFDPATMRCSWSHKSAAAIAGLGSFGVHHMLITDLGCAGRCGSLVIEAELPSSPGLRPNRCQYFEDESCTYCVDACPVQALSFSASGEPVVDKFRCQDHINAVAVTLGPDCCGKCAMGPCALGPAVAR